MILSVTEIFRLMITQKTSQAMNRSTVAKNKKTMMRMRKIATTKKIKRSELRMISRGPAGQNRLSKMRFARRRRKAKLATNKLT